MKCHCVWALCGVLLVQSVSFAQEATPTERSFQRARDVVYGRKHGMALTMDVFTPKKNANGAGVVWVLSGGWVSSHAMIGPKRPLEMVQAFTDRGYTVFAVMHGSQPRFTIPEILEDMHRAVRFIRRHAEKYGVNPQRIGITGGSAGGHLSLMQGTAGSPGNPKAADPVERASSRVQAVGCFFPPTDFLNYGAPGVDAIGRGILKDFHAPFAFHELKKSGYTGEYVPITDEERIQEIGRQISPINHVSADDPPTLIIHGDQDKLVPIQQAEIIVEKLESAGVPAKLVVKEGAGHGWADLGSDVSRIVDWFDLHLQKPKSPTVNQPSAPTQRNTAVEAKSK